MFSKDDFDLLSPVVDGFSLMTYDYPNHGRYVSVKEVLNNYFFEFLMIILWYGFRENL